MRHHLEFTRHILSFALFGGLVAGVVFGAGTELDPHAFGALAGAGVGSVAKMCRWV